jgi:hypothetical protein
MVPVGGDNPGVFSKKLSSPVCGEATHKTYVGFQTRNVTLRLKALLNFETGFLRKLTKR